MSSDVLNLPDVPDLSGFASETQGGSGFEPFADGWYQGTVLGVRTFEDKNGNTRTFASEDTPAQSGESRNIKLQVELVRQADRRTLNTAMLVNYRQEDLTQEVIQQVTKANERVKEGEAWDKSLFRSFMTLTRLSKLQKIAKIRQFQKTEEGGLDLTPLYGKQGWFKIGPDARSEGKYKEVKDIRDTQPNPTKTQVF